MTTRFIEEHLASLKWSEDGVSDYEKTLIIANIRHFSHKIATALKEMKKSRNFPGMDGGEYDAALNDAIALLEAPDTN